MSVKKITHGPNGPLSPAKQRDPAGWPFGTLFPEDMKHQLQLKRAREKRAAKKAAASTTTTTTLTNGC